MDGICLVFQSPLSRQSLGLDQKPNQCQYRQMISAFCIFFLVFRQGRIYLELIIFILFAFHFIWMFIFPLFFSFYNIMILNQKKIWSDQQDLILKKLYQEQEMRNWSMIAKKMAVEYNLPRKSAKQCRQRYENHINTETAKAQWTIQEQLMLIQYHNEIGNKWSLIVQKIPGKSDNCVKNHFYSKLRKVLRKLNTIIHHYFRRQFREININTIYKIVQACEEQFKEKPNCQAFVSASCREIQNKMLNLSMLKEEQLQSQDRIALYREVIRQIYSVSKLYKRKSKKTRINSIQAPNNKGRKKKQVIVVSNQMQGYMSDSSSAFQDGEEEQISKNNSAKIQKQEEIAQQPNVEIKYHKNKKKSGVIVQEEEQGIKNLLQDAGILHYQKSQINSHNGLKFSSRSSFKSYSQKNDSDQQFFEDSDNQKGFFSRRKNSCFRNFASFSQKSEGQGPNQFYFS